MYESFFGLSEKPFNMTPDPRFLYLSKKHREALAQLIYGVKEKKGFVVLSGDVGTGKTTIVRALLERVDESCQVAYIFNTKLSTIEFLKLVCHDFGLEVTGDSKIDYLMRLHDFLIASHQAGKTTVLIVDEAQNLDASLFEEIRMLTNLETSDQKLFQIFLVGQPELNDLLDRSDLWQLKQRISNRYHLLPLDRDETKGYIHTRMRIAGAKRLNCFTEGAIQKIYAYSQGIPRLINNICDNALLLGYANDSPTINEKTVRECVADLKLEENPKGRKVAVAGRTNSSERHPVRYAVLAIVAALVAVGIALFLLGRLDVPRWVMGPSETQPISQRTPMSEANESAALEVGEGETVTPNSPSLSEAGLPAVGAQIPEGASSVGAPTEEGKAPGMSVAAVPGKSVENPSTRLVIAQDGDTLSHIVLQEFGRVDAHLLDVVRKLNPEIEDINEIIAGQEIRLPVDPLEAYKNPGMPSYFSSHVASFKKFDEAERFFTRIIQSGEKAALYPAKVRGKELWYRVTIGEYRDAAEASQKTAKLVESGRFLYAKPLKLPELLGADGSAGDE